MGIQLVLPQSRTGLMDYRTRYIHVYRMQILLTAGLREQNINVTQLWPGILKFSQINCLKKLLENKNCKRTLQDTNGS